MSSFTVDPEKTVEVKMNYLCGDDGQIVVLNDTLPETMNGKYKVAVAKFARASWGVFNSFVKNSYIYHANANTYTIDELALKFQKFRSLLTKLVDGDNVPVVLDDAFFNSVNPEFVMNLVDKYDSILDMERVKMLEKIIEEPKKDE